MAAIDDFKALRDEVAAALANARAHKQTLQQEKADAVAAYDARIAAAQATVDSLVARRERIVQGIRDLTDNWNPAP